LEVRLVRENVALAMAQWTATKKGLITKGHLPTGKAYVPTHDGKLVEVFNPLELLSDLDLARCVNNQVRGAVAFSAMLTHSVLEQVFGDPLQEDFDPNLSSAFCAVYLLNNAMSRDMLAPVWDCPKRYPSYLEVSPISFVLDTIGLDGRPVFWEHFGGLEKYLELLEYCAQRLEQSGDIWPRLSSKTVKASSNGPVQPAASQNSDSSVAAYLDATCVLDPEAYTIAGELYTNYIGWCRDAGRTPLPQRSFGLTLTKLGFVRKRRGRGRHWWKGLEPAQVAAV
jgi:hypothetical protein